MKIIQFIIRRSECFKHQTNVFISRGDENFVQTKNGHQSGEMAAESNFARAGDGGIGRSDDGVGKGRSNSGNDV